MRAFYPVANRGIVRLGFNGNFAPGGPQLPGGGLNGPFPGPGDFDFSAPALPGLPAPGPAPAPAPAPGVQPAPLQPPPAYLFPTGEEKEEPAPEPVNGDQGGENGNGISTTSIMVGAAIAISLVGLFFAIK